MEDRRIVRNESDHTQFSLVQVESAGSALLYAVAVPASHWLAVTDGQVTRFGGLN